MKYYKLLLTVALGMATVSSFASPAKRNPIEVQQPDGTILTVLLQGDEYQHFYTTTDNLPIRKCEDGYFRYMENSNRTVGNVIARNITERSNADKSYLASLPTQEIRSVLVKQNAKNRVANKRGLRSQVPQYAKSEEPVHGLIILVAFKDQGFSSVGTNEAFTEMMNAEGYSKNRAIGSARDYFISQSNGKFKPIFDVVGPVTLTRNMAYYGGNDYNDNDIRPEEMIVDACQAADKLGVDFSRYDLNNDGEIDLVYVIYAGYSEAAGADANTIWPHAWAVYDGAQKTATVDGLLINNYACSSELDGTDGLELDGIGTFCHEYSHTLGLPDFYNTEDSYDFTMDAWSIMDYGCYNNDGKVPLGYSAYEREYVGWMTIEDLGDTPQSIRLENLADSQKAYKIVSDRNANEYFVFENRQQTGWDAYMEASGLMITAVAYDQTAWDNNDLNNGYKKRMYVVAADNSYSSRTLYGDLYPYAGNNTFTKTSRPASTTYSGYTLDRPVTEITHKDGIITFDYMGGASAFPTPVATAATDIKSASFTANWNAVEGATSYTLQVDKVNKNLQVVFSENFDLFTKHESTNISSTLDTYTQTKGWGGQNVFCYSTECKLGSKSNDGNLVTPAIDLSGNNGAFTVSFDARSFGTDNSSVVVYLWGNADAEQIVPLESTNTTISLNFTGGTSNSQIVIEGESRIIIDNLAISSAAASSGDNDPNTYPLIFTDITGTSYTVSGLAEGNDYLYKVKAVGAEGESSFSNTITVSLSNNNSAVEKIGSETRIYGMNGNQIAIHCERPSEVTVYSITGAQILRQQIGAGFNAIAMNVPGMYIVKCGDTITKVRVK